jgi:hypothetical protein
VKRVFVLVSVLCAVFISPLQAAADIPITNKNAGPATFHCMRGSEHTTFVAVGITQSAAIAGQVLTNQSVVVFTRLLIDGQLIFEVPGQANRSDLWTCTVEEDPSVLVEAFLTPRR